MKHTAAIALFLAASFLFTTGSASAQDHLMKVTVPFNFTVGDRTLPSGTYKIGSDVNSSILSINSWDKNVHLLTMGQPNHSYADQRNALLFHRYGGEYYLSDIVSTSSSMNIHFPTTKAEKRAKARTEEAGLFSNEPVLIALN